jgi:inosine-uridine nucleoside N-ribohydrolase
VLVGLDVTHQALITPAQIDRIRDGGGAVGRFIHDISSHYGAHYARRTGWPGFPMHDSAAVLYAIDPGYFGTERWYIEVETVSPRAAGMVMTDRRAHWKQSPNAEVCVTIDNDQFLELYLARLAVGP